MDKEEVIYEDKTIKISAIPTLLRIVVEAKTENEFEAYKAAFKIFPTIRGLMISE